MSYRIGEGMSGVGPLERVRGSFEKQGLMALLGAEVVEARSGLCVIEVPCGTS